MFSRGKTRSDDRYGLIKEIGRGGMGVVWKATDKRVGGHVAVKMLLDEFDKQAFELFQQECKKLAALPYHPNITRITDVGEINGKPFFAMPLLEGATLAELLNPQSMEPERREHLLAHRGALGEFLSHPDERLPIDRLVEIITHACKGLQWAHQNGIIHRDVKPSNIFVLHDFTVQIIDFGVAHQANGRSGTVGRKGTIPYMSPEQIQAKPLTTSSDIFSLGVVCYEAFSGKRPFDGKDDEKVAEAIVSASPRFLNEIAPVGVAIGQAVYKALAKQTANRYLTASEFGDVLNKASRLGNSELFPFPRPRLALASEYHAKGEDADALKLLETLLAEGISHPDITDLKARVDGSIRQNKITKGIAAARSLMESKDYDQALRELIEVRGIDPTNTDALALAGQIDSRRTDDDVEDLLRQTRRHMDAYEFDAARRALDRIKKRRPKEPRLTQFSGELNRIEEEYQQLQRERQKHFDAAQSALHRKDISSAHSHVEKLAELAKQFPNVPDPRKDEYSNLRSHVQTERDSIESALAQANELIGKHDLPSALEICQRYLSRYPTHEHLLHLHFRIEELQRESLAAKVKETEALLRGEPDLIKQERLLDLRSQEHPQESYFRQSLERVKKLRGIVDEIVARAKAHEGRREFQEAFQEWQKLKTIYSRYAGLDAELERVSGRRAEHDKRQRRDKLVQQVNRLIEGREFNEALTVLKNAESDFQNESEVKGLEKLARKGIESLTQARSLLEEGQAQWARQEFEAALRTLRKAFELDRANLAISSSLIDCLVAHAMATMPHDPKAAELSLREALAIDPDHSAALGLIDQMHDRRHESTVDEAIAEALRMQAEGDSLAALRLIERAIRDLGADPRLLQRQASLQKQLEREKPYRRLETIVDPVGTTGPLDPPFPGPPPSPPDKERQKRSTTNDGQAEWRQRLASWTSAKLSLDLSWLSKRPRWAITAGAAVALLAILGGFAFVVTWVRSGPIKPQAPTPVVAQPVAVPPVQEATVVPPPPEPQVLVVGGQPAYVTLDQDTPNRKLVQSGQEFRAELQDGEHPVEAFTSPTQRVSFKAVVQAGVPATIASIQAQGAPTVIISSQGTVGRVYAVPAMALVMDGNSIGTVGESGVDLPPLQGEKHTLRITIAGATVQKDILLGAGRMIAVHLKPDPYLADMLLKTNPPDGVRLELSDANGRKLPLTSRSGQARFSNLRPGVYTILASKEGYQPYQESVQLQAAQSLTRDVTLVAVPTTATVTLTSKGGATVSLQGRQITIPTEGSIVLRDLPPGSARFDARMPGYRDVAKTVDLRVGENGTVDLSFADRLPGTLRLRRNPANAIVALQRDGEQQYKPVNGDQIELPEGLYHLRAEAKDFGGQSLSVSIKANEVTTQEIVLQRTETKADTKPSVPKPLIGTWDKNVWSEAPDGSRFHKNKGPAPVGQSPGTFAFRIGPQKGKFLGVIPSPGKPKMQWQIGAATFVLEENGRYTSKALIRGSIVQLAGPLVLKKQDSYEFEITTTEKDLTVRLKEDGQWRVIDTQTDLNLRGPFAFVDQIQVFAFGIR